MPMTNDDYVAGCRARREQEAGGKTAVCPFRTGDLRGASWLKGFLAVPKPKPDGAQALAKLAKDGVQGHNMAEIAASWAREGLADL